MLSIIRHKLSEQKSERYLQIFISLRIFMAIKSQYNPFIRWSSNVTLHLLKSHKSKILGRSYVGPRGTYIFVGTNVTDKTIKRTD